MTILALTVPGDPRAKARPRHTANGRVYTPRATHEAERVIAMLARHRRGPARPTENPVGIAVEFYCATHQRTDGDNLLKLVTDALNGIVFKDDSQIVEWFCRLHRGVGVQAARTEIRVWEIF